MARKFYTDIDLNGNKIQNAIIDGAGAQPDWEQNDSSADDYIKHKPIKSVLSNNDAFEISDENDNVAFAINNNGGIKTHSFDSDTVNANLTSFREEINLSKVDYGVEMATGINYYLEDDVIVCNCKNVSGGVLKIFTAVGSGVARGSGCFVNFSTGQIGFYAGLSSTSSQTIKYQRQTTLTFATNRVYIVEMRKQLKKHILKITDAYSLEYDEYAVFPTGSSDIGEHWGQRSYTADSGITVNSFKNYSLEPYNCRLLIIGDSFIEGATGFATNYNNRYCIRLKRILQGSCAISGFGGATISQIRSFYNAYCKTIFKPEYVLIAGGTNDTNYNTWQSEISSLIGEIEAVGAIPVLVTITRRLDNDNLNFMQSANDWIRNNSGKRYIDFNIITTVNYDGVTQNTSMFATDKVHPLPKTHEIMTQKALIDVPEIFNIQSNYVNTRQLNGGI